MLQSDFGENEVYSIILKCQFGSAINCCSLPKPSSDFSLLQLEHFQKHRYDERCADEVDERKVIT